MTRTGQILHAFAFVALAGCAGSRPPETSSSESVDPRTAVALPADAQQAVLEEMRNLLTAIGGALDGAAKNDSAAILAALAPAGSAAAADPELEALLPDPWKKLAEQTHGGFDSLSAAVRRGATGAALKDTVMVGLARVTSYCTSCHETFRLTVR
ncbi:MAG: hypothetical protein MNPFHGCM_00433 [Gemmatimonadaceae bacterium]|nr:hypothetical protein [Gemmatimonadaceae bacterium]